MGRWKKLVRTGFQRATAPSHEEADTVPRELVDGATAIARGALDAGWPRAQSRS